ncbi:TolC family protein [Filimonas lacunae]|nr:TolC family protein [Filimonas lacunae]
MCLPITVFCQNAQLPTYEMHVSLNEIWDRAEKNNKALLAQNQKLVQSEEEVIQSKREQLPELGLAGNVARVTNMPVYTHGLFNGPDMFPVLHYTYTLGGEAQFLLYNGGKVKRNIEIEKIKHEVATEIRNSTRNEMRFKAASWYLTLKRSYFFRTLLREDIKEQEKLLLQIREMHKNGVVLKTDVLRAELRLSNQQMNLKEVENNIIIGSAQLDVVSGLPDSVIIVPDTLPRQIASPLLAGNETTQVNSALANDFTYKIAEAELAGSKLQLKQVQANLSPKVGLFADFKYSYPQIFLYPYEGAIYSIGLYGVKVSMPLSELYRNKHRVAAARSSIVQKEIQLSDKRDELAVQVKQLYIKYNESLERIDVAKTSIKRAEENLRIFRETYLNQLSLMTDLLDAENQLLQARFDLASANIASDMLYYQLQKTIGIL